ncbi:acyl-CoA thioesterase [Variovorax paradoxus]|uniref:Acyl-CoA thioesterase n=1 Tax=Variovorax paradoxus TaxID=34073 RepID=A0A5Q0M7I6_VARPD|nr:thioesterase family protein [Variovorax paradoxus]QFZ85158.1 acyl-CoA thioesterase [Variovorax paradoxus]
MYSYTYIRRLHWSECDPGGIIFFPNYARWMVEGLNEMFLRLGIDPNAVKDASTRGGLPVLGLSMKFLSAPALHESVTHRILVEKVGGKSIAFLHQFLRGDELLMEAQETRVWAEHLLGPGGGLRTLPVPDDVRALLERTH